MQDSPEPFFIPSIRLTVAITLALEEEAAEPEEESGKPPFDFEIIDEEASSDELLDPMQELDLSVDEIYLEEISPSMHELIEHKREEIAERLYHFLAFLARNPQTEHRVYRIFETIPAGMISMLGLSDRFERLPIALTTEFKFWLSKKEGEQYEASWGKMRLEGDYIELSAKSFHDTLPAIERAIYRRALKGPYS